MTTTIKDIRAVARAKSSRLARSVPRGLRFNFELANGKTVSAGWLSLPAFFSDGPYPVFYYDGVDVNSSPPLALRRQRFDAACIQFLAHSEEIEKKVAAAVVEYRERTEAQSAAAEEACAQSERAVILSAKKMAGV